MKKINLIFAAIFIAFLSQAQTVATFENLALVPDTFWNGSDLSGGFNSGNARFANSYDTTYQAWSGFSYSNMSDSTTPVTAINIALLQPQVTVVPGIMQLLTNMVMRKFILPALPPVEWRQAFM